MQSKAQGSLVASSVTREKGRNWEPDTGLSDCRGVRAQLRVSSQLLPPRLSGVSPQVVSPEERFRNATGAAFATVQEQEQVAEALGVEIILTMLLVLAVCMGAVNEKTMGPLAPFSIGFSVIVDILAG